MRMTRRELWQILSPALAAGAAGGVTAAIWAEPVATVLGAAAGALGGALFAPAQAGPARTGPAPARPEPAAARAAQGGAAGLSLPHEAGRALLEELPLGVLLVDGEGQVRFLNPAAAEIFGRRQPGLFHASALRAPKLLAAIEQARAEGAPAAVEFAAMRSTELHLHAQVRPLSGSGTGGAHVALVVIEDVTQRRRSEELFRDFVANASHELKTPLASITGILETLQGHARDDPEAAERFLGIMAQQAERMRRLVQDMLSLNRIEQNERVPPREAQRLREIVGETVEALRPVAEGAGIALEAELPRAEDVALGSREELAQVFQNLIDNAIKYGRPGDRVRVERASDPGRPGMVGIAVSDTGPGIERRHIPRLTERFYRVSVPTSRARGGTGLGLAIVKHVLSRHRGALEIVSEEGRGSRFTAWLPLAPARAARDVARA
jgi:two-component system phosphate regulon sensor histidine kinase PhoR